MTESLFISCLCLDHLHALVAQSCNNGWYVQVSFSTGLLQSYVYGDVRATPPDTSTGGGRGREGRGGEGERGMGR